MWKYGIPKERVHYRQPPQISLSRPLPRWAGSALTCRLGSRQLSRRGLSLPQLWNRLKAKKWAETRPGTFPSSPPPRTSAPRGRESTAAVTASQWPTAEGTDRRPPKPAYDTNTESSGDGSEETGSSAVCGPGWPLSLSIAPGPATSLWCQRTSHEASPPLSGRPAPPLRCGPSNHIRGSAGAVARVIYWQPRNHRGVCARFPIHPPELGACGRARGPDLEWSEVSRSPQHPFFLIHSPQPHALGVPPTDGEPVAGGWRWT